MLLKNNFVYNKKLGIYTPNLQKEWDSYSKEEQEDIIEYWELERAKISELIKDKEKKILNLQDKIYDISFEDYETIHDEVIQLSSDINDLNIWFRTEGEITKE